MPVEEIIPGLRRAWLPYNEYAASNGDILLWEAHTAAGLAIAIETGGPFVHASGVVVAIGRPWQLAYQEGLNGYASPLSAEVRRHSGKISVFRPDYFGLPLGRASCDDVAYELANSLGGDYEWTNIALIFAQRSLILRALAHVFPCLRRRWEAELERTNHKRTSAICSQNVARAWLSGAGLELVKGKPLSLVTPNDIGLACRNAYLGTLTWPENWNGSRANAAQSAVLTQQGA
ncbi:MAG: hypothetical protein KGO96_12645 [Elusimicrobia bacterium]|nr:hypothetical protein [Elusimicrobiota bacterium]